MAATLLETFEQALRRPVSLAARQRATRHLMDWAGCAVAGASTPAGVAFQKHSVSGEIGSIAVLGQNSGQTARAAAFTMGAFGNPLEMDDLDRAAILHPAPVVIPAALAAAQIHPTKPDVLLDGIVRGYDAMIRLGRTVGPGHYAKFHNTATCGPLGAAAASSSILGLDAEQTLWAMGNALTQAAGFWACRHEDVMTKQLHTARAAEAGLSAAMLAQCGVTGPKHILDGPQGFYEGMCPDAEPGWLLAEPDQWRIHEVSFKPWPACRHCHPAIDAALVLHAQIGTLDDVKSAKVEVYRDAALFCDKVNPQTSLEAKFSLQHAVGVTLADGPPDLAAFESDCRAQNDVAALRERTIIIVEPSLTAAYPSHFGAKLTLELQDGTEISEYRKDAAGDPELPMSDDQLIVKARSLMDWGGLLPEAAQALIDATLYLQTAATLTPLIAALKNAQSADYRKNRMSYRSYFDCFDPEAIVRDHPIGPDFLTSFQSMSRDALFARQDAMFRKSLVFAWQIPFYQRLWGAQGIEPGDIKGLTDITKLPVYSKDDLMDSVERFPPIGDFHGLEVHGEARPPLIFQTTSGTTGRPQPLLYGPKSREIQALLLGRLYLMQGLTARDVIHSVYGHGMVNGGHYVREAITHWVGAQMLTAGTGIETRSENQINLMHSFGATALVGFGDYLKRLAETARHQGLEPGRDIHIKIISGHMGAESAESMSAAWGGAQVYDWYGVGDTGIIAGQGPDRQGMHVFEDAQFLEILDVDTGKPVPAGEIGDMVCTCLYKDDVFPIIRFNSHDVSRELQGDNPLRLPFSRIEGFLGRSDNMVKLRGINIYPQGIGSLLAATFASANGEFYCEVTRENDREDMKAVVECAETDAALQESMEAHLRTRLGVGIAVQLVPPGSTAQTTQIEARQKPIRLIDKRKLS